MLTGEVFVSDSHLGCDSQWIMEPEKNVDGIWGYIRAVRNKKYLALGDNFICDPESNNGCEDEKVDVKLINNGKQIKKLWRRIGDQFVSKFGSKFFTIFSPREIIG